MSCKEHWSWTHSGLDLCCQRLGVWIQASNSDSWIATDPVHPKGSQSWIFIGRTDAEAPILWPPDAKNWLIGKDSDAERDWGQEEKGTTENEMAGSHHSLTRCTWVWVNCGRWWWTGRPCVLRFMGSQRVGHDWATELNWTDPVAC